MTDPVPAPVAAPFAEPAAPTSETGTLVAVPDLVEAADEPVDLDEHGEPIDVMALAAAVGGGYDAAGGNEGSQKPIPDFEGLPIDATIVKTTGNSVIDAFEATALNIDDRIRVVGVVRVVGVRFTPHPKTGATVREHLVKFVELSPTPWDPMDPTDDGVVRQPKRSS